MLTNYCRPTLTWLEVFRDQQDSIGENIRPHIQYHLVAFELRRIIDQARTRIGRQTRRWETANYLFPYVITIKVRRCFPALQRRVVCLRPEFFAPVRRLPNQGLGEAYQLIELGV